MSLQLYYGIGEKEPMSLDAIAKSHILSSRQLTRERVRQINLSGLRNLRKLISGEQ